MSKASPLTSLKHVITLYAFLLTAWGFYRLLFQFPELLEVLLIKPLVWLLPTYYFVRKEKASLASLGITTRNLFPTICLSLILGALFAFQGLFVNFLKYGNLSLDAELTHSFFLSTLALSFLTALSEEITFRGFIFTRINQAAHNEWLANLIASSAWVIIYLPLALLDWHLGFSQLLTYLLLLFLFALGSTFLFARTKNILSPILLHVLWQLPIILYR